MWPGKQTNIFQYLRAILQIRMCKKKKKHFNNVLTMRFLRDNLDVFFSFSVGLFLFFFLACPHFCFQLLDALATIGNGLIGLISFYNPYGYK